jgi:hypothetical protein
MASAIDEIFIAIAAWTPTYDSDVSVNVRSVEEMADTLNAGDLPMRMLLIPGENQDASLSFVSLGKTMSVEWELLDRLYLRVPSHGRGLQDFTADLIAYVKSYVTVIQNNRAPTSQSHVKYVRFEPGIFPWGNNQYAGVDVRLTIEEIIT